MRLAKPCLAGTKHCEAPVTSAQHLTGARRHQLPSLTRACCNGAHSRSRTACVGRRAVLREHLLDYLPRAAEAYSAVLGSVASDAEQLQMLHEQHRLLALVRR